jgi:hypothetical protein
MIKKGGNQTFPKAVTLYQRESDHAWLQAHVAYLNRTGTRHTTLTEIIREAISAYRRLHENEIDSTEAK